MALVVNAVATLQNAVVLADRYPVLAGIDLQIQPGETVAVVGVNGAGKTSVLRLLGGFSRIHSGTGQVCGFDLRSDRSQIRRATGYVPHRPFAYEDLTVLENLEIQLRNSKAVLNDLLERTGLKTKADVRAGQLSSGQRRRLGIASLLGRSAKLWLLDEPYSGLDAEGRQFLDCLLGSARSDGTTIVFSTHDTAAINTASMRIVEVGGGVAREIYGTGVDHVS